MAQDAWNKCTFCGRFIPYKDFENKVAERYIEPDTIFGPEIAINTCKFCVISRDKEVTDEHV